jgi:aspartyl-tRNA(Asn)/glutamyl-tRNA(Gln) amidotransferase subunit C
MSDSPKVNIRALAELARLEVSDAEVAKLEKEIPDILKFVETIQGANVSVEAKASELRNVMREDTNAHESGMYTKRILEVAPKTENDRIVVKQVVTRKQK